MAYHKAKKDRKEEVIRLRVTTEQKDRMVEAARQLGLDISAWLRTMGVQEANRIIRSEANFIPEAVELSKRIAEKRQGGARTRARRASRASS
jgi:uncharacterized protein (DUF1778 family)